MMSQLPAAPGPAGGPAGHAEAELLASYAAGTAGTVAAWSVEAHLTACEPCRTALSERVDPERLARNRSVLLVRAALGDGGRTMRLLRRCGIPDHLLRLLAATPSLRKSWLLSVLGVLAVLAAEAAAVSPGWTPARVLAGLPRLQHPQILIPFLLVAPLLVLAGVAAAFLPRLDPAYQLTVAAPFSGFTLLLVRAVSALAAALALVVAAAFILPGPGWLPAALLLPSLAVCGLALAAASVMEARAAAIAAGTLWVLPVLLLAGRHLPLAIVHWRAQSACAAVLCICAFVLLMRRDRFELGWTR